MSLIIGNTEFQSRLFTGTGKFSSPQIMLEALAATETQLVTLAMKRVDLKAATDNIYQPLKSAGYKLLPNTSGARTADEAIFAAQLAREAMQTEWLKLEIHPDPRYLMPDPIETLAAAECLVQQGFKVLPYIHADPVLARRLEECGCVGVMPLAAPIGSNQGLITREFLQMIIEQSSVPVIVDAGIGAPSHATAAMEMGADAVLVNTAIATAGNPVAIGQAFKEAVITGRNAYLAGIPGKTVTASASSPLTAFLG